MRNQLVWKRYTLYCSVFSVHELTLPLLSFAIAFILSIYRNVRCSLYRSIPKVPVAERCDAGEINSQTILSCFIYFLRAQEVTFPLLFLQRLYSLNL